MIVDDGISREVKVRSVDEGRGWSFEWRVDDGTGVRRELRDLEHRRRRQRLTITETLSAGAEARAAAGTACGGTCARCCCGRARSPSRWCGERTRRPVRGVVRSDAAGAVRPPPQERARHGHAIGATHHAHPAGRRQASPGTGRSRPRRIPSATGREVRYAATPEPLATVVTWLTESSRGWDRRAGPAVCGISSACARATSVITCGDGRPAGNGPDPRPRRRGALAAQPARRRAARRCRPRSASPISRWRSTSAGTCSASAERGDQPGSSPTRPRRAQPTRSSITSSS